MVTRVVNQKHKSKLTLAKTSSNQLDSNKVTHLYLHNKSLYNIGKLSPCENLTVLYMHNNEIRKIENLEPLQNLTSLYLHHNKIRKIENLQNLRNLKKLYLGYNEINVVEGLENLENLEELHIEKQNLRNGDAMCFDPRTIANICHTLQYLNISDNNISTLIDLAPLRFLKSINASNNKLHSIEDICDTIKNWYYLHKATFTGNPVSKKHRYRESIIANTQRLSILDGKDITATTRCFIQRMEANNQRSRQSINLAEKFPNLPKNYPASLQKAASASILRQKEQLETETDISDISTYVPWNTLPSTSAKSVRIPPLLRKQKKRPNVKKDSTVFNITSKQY